MISLADQGTLLKSDAAWYTVDAKGDLAGRLTVGEPIIFLGVFRSSCGREHYLVHSGRLGLVYVTYLPIARRNR